MALATDIVFNDERIGVYNLHLESRGRDSLRHRRLSEVLIEAQRYGAETPVVVAGDFNFDLSRNPQASAIQREHYRNPFTTETRQRTNSNVAVSERPSH